MSIFKNLTTRALIAWDAVSVPVRRAYRDITQGSQVQEDPPIVTTTTLTGADAARVTEQLRSDASRARVHGVFDSGENPEQRSLTDILSVDSSQVQKAIMELGATKKRVIIMPQKNWGAGYEDSSVELHGAALAIAEMARRKKPGEERTAWSYKPLHVNRGETEPIGNAIARTLSDGLAAEVKPSEIDDAARKALNDGGDAIVIFRREPGDLTDLNIVQIKTPMTVSVMIEKQPRPKNRIRPMTI